MTWALAWSPLLSLREGGISGHEDVEMLTTWPQLGSVSLGQGSQLESAPWGPICSQLQKHGVLLASWEKNHRAEASSAERKETTKVC